MFFQVKVFLKLSTDLVLRRHCVHHSPFFRSIAVELRQPATYTHYSLGPSAPGMEKLREEDLCKGRHKHLNGC
jgi:hypothetical protein